MLRTQFTPRHLANLQLWLDASDASTITQDGSNNVSQWNDKSGKGNNVTQTTAANRPAYTTAGQRGMNVVTFDGSNDFLTTPTLTISQPYTIIWAGRSNGNAPGGDVNGPYCCDGTTSTTRVAIGWNGDGTSATNGRLFSFAGTAVIQAASGTQAYNAWSVVSAVYNGSSSLLRANAVQIGTGNPGSTAISALRLGDRFSSIPSAFTAFKGPWGAFLIYSRALPTAELLALERYLAALWAIAL